MLPQQLPRTPSTAQKQVYTGALEGLAPLSDKTPVRTHFSAVLGVRGSCLNNIVLPGVRADPMNIYVIFSVIKYEDSIVPHQPIFKIKISQHNYNTQYHTSTTSDTTTSTIGQPEAPKGLIFILLSL